MYVSFLCVCTIRYHDVAQHMQGDGQVTGQLMQLVVQELNATEDVDASSITDTLGHSQNFLVSQPFACVLPSDEIPGATSFRAYRR